MKNYIDIFALERADLMAELISINTKIEALDLVLQLLTDSKQTSSYLPRKRSPSESIRSILMEAGPQGLSTISIIDVAAKRGLRMKKNSTSSLLSRMKRNGEIIYKNRRYIIRKPRK